jgi:putative glutamine amidotransferase
VKIGLSYDQGTPKYRLYLGALLAAAADALYEVEPVWLAATDKALDMTALNEIDGLILTGGADVEPHRYGFRDDQGVCKTFPGRDDAEIAALDVAFARRLPVLAICRGMQLLNVHQGGTLVPDLGNAHKKPDEERHVVQLESGSTLHRLVGSDSGQVTTSHHQAVAELGDGLIAVAKHADGTIEAIEWAQPMRKPWLAAVQWHPERMGLDEPFSGPLFKSFLDAIRARTH